MFIAHSTKTMQGARQRLAERGVRPVEPRHELANFQRRRKELDQIRDRATAGEISEVLAETIVVAETAMDHAEALLRVRRRVTMDQIMRRISRATKVSKADLISPRRDRRAVLARQAVMYWTFRRTSLSLPQIGRLLGNRDHTTVLHGVKVYPVKRAEQNRTVRALR